MSSEQRTDDEETRRWNEGVRENIRGKRLARKKWDSQRINRNTRRCKVR